MKKKNEMQKLLDEVSDSLDSFRKELVYWLKAIAESLAPLGEELYYWTSAFVESVIKEFENLPQELFSKFTGGFTPPMEFDLNDVTEDDIACRRYGPQTVKMPK